MFEAELLLARRHLQSAEVIAPAEERLELMSMVARLGQMIMVERGEEARAAVCRCQPPVPGADGTRCVYCLEPIVN